MMPLPSGMVQMPLPNGQIPMPMPMPSGQAKMPMPMPMPEAKKQPKVEEDTSQLTMEQVMQRMQVNGQKKLEEERRK